MTAGAWVLFGAFVAVSALLAVALYCLGKTIDALDELRNELRRGDARVRAWAAELRRDIERERP